MESPQKSSLIRFDRRHPFDRTEDQREPGQRDRDRVLYSSAFRRLAGITQVAAAAEVRLIHNRLTHSLEVAQIGRRLSENLLLVADEEGWEPLNLDPDIVETACLAHDLGHPPFGHVAEQELDNLVLDREDRSDAPGGFGGNAQSFRIVNKLSVRHDQFPGLNLTRASLNAILKYPWPRRDGERYSKWGTYVSERADFDWARQLSPLHGDELALEAQLMDWADDVAYAVHDLEDFFRAGLLPLDRLVEMGSESERFWADFVSREGDRISVSQAEARKLFESLMALVQRVTGLEQPFQGLVDDRAKLRSLTSTLIMRYIRQAVAIDRDKSSEDELVLSIDQAMNTEVQILKGFTWYYVINRPSLATQQYGQRKVVRDLFDMLFDAAASNESDDEWILSPGCREQLHSLDDELGERPERDVARIVTDEICSLTESQCLALHNRLAGTEPGHLTSPI